jgi:DNA-binding response OmpR family regulator
MVIDDEIELASLFKEFLRKRCYNVVSFTDPILAFEYFRET